MCSATWFIKAFKARSLSAKSSDYYDTLPTDTSHYFTLGGKYNEKDQTPVITEDGAQALYGCSAEQAIEENKYSVEFIQGTYKDTDLGRIEEDTHKGLVAGTHYYKITDNTTGQVICLKHEVAIEKSIFKVTSYKQPDKAIYFSGDNLGGLYAKWVNDTIENKEITYEHRGTAEDFYVTASDSSVPAYQGGVMAGIEQAYKNNTSQLTILKNNYEVEAVDLTYKVLPRCYFESSGTKTYYSSLTYALGQTQSASGTLVAMPSFTYNSVTYSSVLQSNGYVHEITDNCTIGKNVALWVPFDHTTESASNGGKSIISTTTSSSAVTESCLLHQNTFNLDKDADGIPDFRKNLVTVNEGVTITNNGKIYISAQVTGAAGGAKNASVVAGSYAEIQLQSKANSVAAITSKRGSIINCYGFITQAPTQIDALDSQVNLESGSTMTTVFTIYEHRGGTVFLDMIGGYSAALSGNTKPIASPFNRFFTQSVTANVNVTYGASLNGFYILTTSAGDTTGSIQLIGTSSANFIQLKNNAAAKIRFDFEKQQNVASVEGDASINPISVTVKQVLTIDLSTATVFLPISHYWHIDFKKNPSQSEITKVSIASQDVKILPGGYVKLHEGVEATVKSLNIYDSASLIPTHGGFDYPTDKGEGTIIVDGTLIVQGGLGGTVISERANAILTLASNSATSTELNATSNTTADQITLNANADIFASPTDILKEQTLNSNSSYLSKEYDSGKFAFVNRNITLTYTDVLTDESGNIISVDTENTTEKSHTTTKDGITFTKFSKDGYIIDGYYTDASLTNVADPSAVFFSATVYVKWKPVPTYTITYDANGKTGVTFSGGVASSPVGTFTDYHTECPWNTDTSKAYEFIGWSTDPAATEPQESFEVTEEGLTLYAVWKAKTPVKISLSNASITIDGTSYSNGATLYLVQGSTPSIIVKYSETDSQTLKIGSTTYSSGTTSVDDYTFSGASEITITVSSKSCIAAGTLITLADGTQKKVEDILESDVLLVFDHEIGKFVEAPILFIERDGWADYNIINLKFSDGRVTRLIYEHALFDITLNKYVYITENNLTEFIGHEFAVIDTDEISTVTLTEAFITTEYTGCFSLVTAYHLNYFIDGLFSIPGGIDGLFNIFEYGDGLKYNEEKMQADIDKYGLYSYEDFAEYLPEELYNAFPAPYFKVSVGKGYVTFEEILGYIHTYLVKNGLM